VEIRQQRAAVSLMVQSCQTLADSMLPDYVALSTDINRRQSIAAHSHSIVNIAMKYFCYLC